MFEKREQQENVSHYCSFVNEFYFLFSDLVTVYSFGGLHRSLSPVNVNSTRALAIAMDAFPIRTQLIFHCLHFSARHFIIYGSFT